MAPPSSITAETVGAVIRAVRRGESRRQAAGSAGIGQATLFRWLKLAKVERDRPGSSRSASYRRHLLEGVEQAERARARGAGGGRRLASAARHRIG